MDPTYTTTDPAGLWLTSSGLALDSPGATGVLEPILYDPNTMSTPWMDPSTGVNVAMQQDGSIVPVAIRSVDIQPADGGLPTGVTNLLATGVQSLGTQLQRWLSPLSAPATPVASAGVLGGMSPTTLLLLGVGAYFLLRKKR